MGGIVQRNTIVLWLSWYRDFALRNLDKSAATLRTLGGSKVGGDHVQWLELRCSADTDTDNTPLIVTR